MFVVIIILEKMKESFRSVVKLKKFLKIRNMKNLEKINQ